MEEEATAAAVKEETVAEDSRAEEAVAVGAAEAVVAVVADVEEEEVVKGEDEGWAVAKDEVEMKERQEEEKQNTLLSLPDNCRCFWCLFLPGNHLPYTIHS